MKNVTRHTGKLEILSRLESSRNGNPRYLLSVDGITCKTGVDCMIGYEAPNYDGKQVVATIGTHYGSAQIQTVKPL